MAAKKFTEREREEIYVKVSELWKKNWTAKQMAVAVGVSERQVQLYVQKIRAEWQEQLKRNADEKMAHLLAQQGKVKQEAWEQWERSKQDGQKVLKLLGKEKKDGDGDGDESPGLVVKTETWGQCGDPRYLEKIQKAIDYETELQGLFPPKRIAPTTPKGDALFSFLSKPIEEMTDDELAMLRNAANALSPNH